MRNLLSVPSPSKVKTAPTKRQRSPSPKKGSEHSKEDNVKDDPSYVPNTEPSDNGMNNVYYGPYCNVRPNSCTMKIAVKTRCHNEITSNFEM